MNSMLPPTRDLPPGRQTRIRVRLENAVGPRRSSIKPVLAGAAAITAIVVGAVFLMPGQEKIEPAVQPAPFTTALNSTPDFGISPENVKMIEEGCAKSAGTGRATMRQYLPEQTRWAVLYTDRDALVCNIGVGGMEYNSAFGQTAVDWLPGHFSVDHAGASSGGDGSKPEYQGVPGNRTVVGRIDSKVARVTYTVDGQTVEAKIANGTYAARIHYPSNWRIPNTAPRESVQAYDAEGRLLGTGADQYESCYADPRTGAIVYGDRNRKKEDCREATPWK